MERAGQIGLIALFAEKFGPSHNLGRKAFQKIVHLASDLAEIPTGYKFSFYTYGAYSRELASDLEFAEDISVIVGGKELNSLGYDIQAGPLSKNAIEHSGLKSSIYKKKLDWLTHKFQNQTARSLELYSTVVFVKRSESKLADEELCAKIGVLKPKYSVSEIQKAIDQVKGFESELSKL